MAESVWASALIDFIASLGADRVSAGIDKMLGTGVAKAVEHIEDIFRGLDDVDTLINFGVRFGNPDQGDWLANRLNLRWDRRKENGHKLYEGPQCVDFDDRTFTCDNPNCGHYYTKDDLDVFTKFMVDRLTDEKPDPAKLIKIASEWAAEDHLTFDRRLSRQRRPAPSHMVPVIKRVIGGAFTRADDALTDFATTGTGGDIGRWAQSLPGADASEIDQPQQSEMARRLAHWFRLR